MNARTPLTASIIAITILAAPLAAQLRMAQLNGVWKQLPTQVVRPDSSYMQPVPEGKSIIFNGHFVQFYVRAATGPQQAGRTARAAAPATAEEKAARYDMLTGNAGTFELRDTVGIVHYQYAKNPAVEGSTLTATVRLRGDTLWETVTSPWVRDSTKSVRTTFKYVRQK